MDGRNPHSFYHTSHRRYFPTNSDTTSGMQHMYIGRETWVIGEKTLWG